MYGFLWKISVFEVVLLAFNCFFSLSAGLIFSIFPDIVQRYQLERRGRKAGTGGWTGWLGSVYGAETRFIASGWYVRFLAAFGYACLLLSGILTGFLVTYMMRV